MQLYMQCMKIIIWNPTRLKILNSYYMLLRVFGYMVFTKLFEFKWLIKTAQQKSKDVVLQNWYSTLNISFSSNSNYRLFKQTFEQSKFISLTTPYMCRRFLAFWTRNHRFPVEVGWLNGQPLQERKCAFYNNDIGDEYHFLLVCRKFLNERQRLPKPYYYVHPNILKYYDLMNTTNSQLLKKLCMFVDILLKNVSV